MREGIEGTFRGSEAEDDARRCTNRPKATSRSAALPPETGHGDPLHKPRCGGLTGMWRYAVRLSPECVEPQRRWRRERSVSPPSSRLGP